MYVCECVYVCMHVCVHVYMLCMCAYVYACVTVCVTPVKESADPQVENLAFGNHAEILIVPSRRLSKNNLPSSNTAERPVDGTQRLVYGSRQQDQQPCWQ